MRAARLIFEYEGEDVRLVSQQQVDVAAANVQTAGGDVSGVFVDVRDASNGTLARVPARDAMTTSLEVFPERQDEPITRVTVPRGKGAFTVLIPMPDEADHATIVRVEPRTSGVPPGLRASASDAVDLVSFPLNPGR